MRKREHFWKVRSAHYDKLFWTKDQSYMDHIIKCADLVENDLVLDVGCGTGAVANGIKPHVKHVVGIDISDDMLSKGEWAGVSLVKCDISEHIFSNNLFDKIIARMIFHHILENINRAFIRCYDLLKVGGKLIVAEGVPPSDKDCVVQWYSEMFSLKEERRTFRTDEIADYMYQNGFVDVRQEAYIMHDFSVKNWLVNSGLTKKKQDKIMDMHVQATDEIKKLYKMQFVDGDCFITTKNIITTGNRLRSNNH